MSAPKDWVACDVPPEGYNAICVYAAAFEAGMRLPFHDLHAAVLRHYGLAPSQQMPNSWRYLNAFVLLCEDAGVASMLPVFLSFFLLCADKGESMGRYILKPYPLPPLDSGSSSRRHRRCRLFTGKMPHSPMWKDRFFFICGPMPWPCSLKWGKPSMASVQEPVLTNDTTEARHKLVHLAGDTGIDIMKFLSKRNPPVGHLQILAAATPQKAAVKEEATATHVVAAWTEQTRKRKSPEPITPISPLSLSMQIGIGYDDTSTESEPAPAGLGPGHGEPRVTGGERSRSRMLFQLVQEVTADLDANQQELQASREQLLMVTSEVVLLQEQLVGANANHVTTMGQLVDELQKANDNASRYAQELQKAKAEASRSVEELQKAKAEVRHIKTKHGRGQMELEREKNRMVREAYDKGVRATKELVVNIYGDAIDLSEFTEEIDTLLVGSSLPLGPGLAPQAPVDDQ